MTAAKPGPLRHRHHAPSDVPPDLLISWLAASHFLHEVPNAQLAQLATYARVRDLRAGDYVWHQADVANAFHIIVQGLVSIQRMHISGTEHTIGIFGNRESIGEIAVCQRIKFPADAVVISTRARIVIIDAERLLADAKLHHELAHALQQTLSRHGAGLLHKIQLVAVGSVTARLAGLFLHLADRFGETMADGAILVPVSLSRAALANLVSARTETVIRALRPWDLADVVTTRGDGFILRSLPTLQSAAAKG